MNKSEYDQRLAALLDEIEQLPEDMREDMKCLARELITEHEFVEKNMLEIYTNLDKLNQSYNAIFDKLEAKRLRLNELS